MHGPRVKTWRIQASGQFSCKWHLSTNNSPSAPKTLTNLKAMKMGYRTNRKYLCFHHGASRTGTVTLRAWSLFLIWRQRHLMNDLAGLLPHSKKDAKLDTKSKLYHLNELADLYNCNNVLFFESRKHGQDLYLWLSKAPNGPTVKLHLQNCTVPAPVGAC